MMPSTGLSQDASQMIPTPGLNNSKLMSVNSEYSHGGGLSSFNSSMVSQHPQQKQYVGSQNNRILQSLGGQRGGGMRSNIQHKTSTYGLTNGVLSGSLGLVAGNVQAVNGIDAIEGYATGAAYGSSPTKPLQNFDRQHHQQVVPSNLFDHSSLVCGLLLHAFHVIILSGCMPLFFCSFLVDYF